jgi:holo-[acyl-carrier protein] synthase
MQLHGGSVVGIGIDHVELPRFALALERSGERFERRLFTRGELESCRDRRDRVAALAARFAAKEACMKALGTGWSEGVAFSDIEVVRERGAAPQLRLHGAAARVAAARGVRTAHVSLSHQRGMALAFVVLERAAS